MEPERPDQDADEAPYESACLKWLDDGRGAVRAAKGDRERIAAAVLAFCDYGRRKLFFAPLVVWDYLVVSYPGLLREAGLSDDEVEQLLPAVEQAWVRAYEGWNPTEGIAAGEQDDG
jgi:hypothetical protein